MIRSSALYLSVVISLLIVLVCGAVLMAGFMYRMQNKAEERSVRLKQNIASGMALVFSADFPSDTSMLESLFEGTGDSVRLSRQNWGLYEMGSVEAWINTDTLSRNFLIAGLPEDSSKVFFLSDEDRPISISGSSLIKGTAFLPKAGIKAAYVEGKAYNDKTLVYGSVRDSERKLPALSQKHLERLQRLLLEAESGVFGGLELLADSAVQINADFKSRNALIVARSVNIADDFKGQLQVIASDSIILGDRVVLDYPSALVVLKNDSAGFQRQLKIGKDCQIAGAVMSWEQDRSTLMPVISIGEGSVIKGEVWSQGYVSLGRHSRVDGAVSAIRLMARVSGSLYENYLIDVQLDITRRSRYYLSPPLLNQKPSNAKILCWLN